MDLSKEEAYRILGLEKDASFREVMEAHRDLVEVWDPKRFTGNPRLENKAVQQFRQINAAFERIRRSLIGERGPVGVPDKGDIKTSRKRLLDETLIGTGRNSARTHSQKDRLSNGRSRSGSVSKKTSGFPTRTVTVTLIILVILTMLISMMMNDETSEPVAAPSPEEAVQPETAGPEASEASKTGPENRNRDERDSPSTPQDELAAQKSKQASQSKSVEERKQDPGKKPILKREIIE